MTKKICKSCGKEIDEKKDEWYEDKLFKKGVEDSVIFWHRKCKRKYHKTEFQKVYKKKLKNLKPIIDFVGGQMKV